MILIDYHKEIADTDKLLQQIKSDDFVGKDTILINCFPQCSSIITQLVNHKLSNLNKNELYEVINLEVPYNNMSQVWNGFEKEYQLYDIYLKDWFSRFIDSSYKYLFIMNFPYNEKALHKIEGNIKLKLKSENYRIASLYKTDESKIRTDYNVEILKNSDFYFHWQNSNNKNLKS